MASCYWIVPGRLRRDEVTVGRHLAPAFQSLPEFLQRFAAAYGSPNLNTIDQVVAAAASHHRLALIHPFLDGNGRMTRLFTHAYLVRARIDGHGLWTMSRGFARNRDAYLAALAGADEHRRGDLDGRGNLSNQGLRDLLDQHLLTAESEKGPVRLAFPAKVAGYYFPRLYPEGVEML